MPRHLLVAPLLLAACDAAIDPAQDAPTADVLEQSVIYGADDRLDYYQLTDPDLIALADATAVLVDANQLYSSGSNIGISTPGTYGSNNGLCSTEPFYNQPEPGWCTGFLVGPETLVTAGHCVSNSDCNSTRFVFGFRMNNASSSREIVSQNDVYSCDAVLARENSGTRDYSVIRLDRPVTGRTPLAVRASGAPSVGTGLVISGHPNGLPVKVAGGATVKGVSSNYLESNLDSYGGNSGSPVVNASTGVVEGILVRGENDFDWTGSCYVSNTCSNSNGCPGFEELTRASIFEQYIPDAPVVPTCTEDAFEPNDSYNTARLWSVGTTTNLQACAGNDDWYAVDVEDGDTFQAVVSFQNSLGNLGAALYNTNGIRIDLSDGNGNNETLSATASGDGVMYVRVFGTDDNTYSLAVTRTPAVSVNMVLTAGSPAVAGAGFVWNLSGAAANDADLWLVSGVPGQTTQVPGCPTGVRADVGNAWVAGRMTANGAGDASYNRLAPASVAGRAYTFQVASLSTCELSNPLVVQF